MRANNDRKKNGWAQIFLFIIFLILLALVLNGMGWCIGGVCEVGTDMLKKSRWGGSPVARVNVAGGNRKASGERRLLCFLWDGFGKGRGEGRALSLWRASFGNRVSEARGCSLPRGRGGAPPRRSCPVL